MYARSLSTNHLQPPTCNSYTVMSFLSLFACIWLLSCIVCWHCCYYCCCCTWLLHWKSCNSPAATSELPHAACHTLQLRLAGARTLLSAAAICILQLCNTSKTRPKSIQRVARHATVASMCNICARHNAAVVDCIVLQANVAHNQTHIATSTCSSIYICFRLLAVAPVCVVARAAAIKRKT